MAMNYEYYKDLLIPDLDLILKIAWLTVLSDIISILKDFLFGFSYTTAVS